MAIGDRDSAGAPVEIAHHRFLDEGGQTQGPLPRFAQSRSELVGLYRGMVLCRSFDEKAVALQRTGRLGTFASSLGQEGVSVGTASAMHDDDVLLPSFREQGAQLWRGVMVTELLLFWGGDERGSDFGGPREDFPVCIPVGSHVPHAAGVALAMQLRGEKRAAVCMFGDGATSKGDFYEALNLAGVWNLPAVFVINNNQWAISVPLHAQTAAETLAHKAVAVGMPGVQVDGNDVIAVRHVTAEAIARARAGGGPTLVEAVTYRLADHTTVDDASRYRDDGEVSKHWHGEPVARLRNYLVAAHGWSKDEEEQLIEHCSAQVEDGASEYLQTEAQPPEAMFDYLYAELPPDIASQRVALAEEQ